MVFFSIFVDLILGFYVFMLYVFMFYVVEQSAVVLVLQCMIIVLMIAKKACSIFLCLEICAQSKGPKL